MMASDLPTARWRKSSRSTSTSTCVEVAFLDAEWRKSNRSGNTSDCVEVAYAQDMVAVRDSKNPDGPALVVASGDWGVFLYQAKRGGFDL